MLTRPDASALAWLGRFKAEYDYTSFNHCETEALAWLKACRLQPFALEPYQGCCLFPVEVPTFFDLEISFHGVDLI
jgi:hypothetical protein